MADRHVVAMLMLHFGTARDEVGVFEVLVDADDYERALSIVWGAVAASGTDDHTVFLEHPDLPEHWSARSGRPAAA